MTLANPQALLADVQQHLSNGALDAAALGLRTLIKSGFADPELYYFLGITLRSAGNEDEGNYWIGRTLAERQNHFGAYAETLKHYLASCGVPCESNLALRPLRTINQEQLRSLDEIIANDPSVGATFTLSNIKTGRKDAKMHLLQNATLLGAHHLALTNKGEVFLEQQTGTFCSEFHNHQTALYVTFMEELSKVKSPLTGEYVSLVGPWLSNFHHWLIEGMPQVALAELAGFKGTYLIGAEPEFALDSLLAFGIPRERILKTTDIALQVSSLYIPSFRSEHDIPHYHDLIKYLRQRFLDNCAINLPQQTQKRLFVSRKRRDWPIAREIGNEDELVGLLEKYNFERVLMEEFNFKEKIALTANAECLLGPHGAGMAHCLFLPEGSHIIELFSPKYINPCLTELLRICGHKYHMIVARKGRNEVPHELERIEAPCDILSQILEQIYTGK